MISSNIFYSYLQNNLQKQSVNNQEKSSTSLTILLHKFINPSIQSELTNLYCVFKQWFRSRFKNQPFLAKNWLGWLKIQEIQNTASKSSAKLCQFSTCQIKQINSTETQLEGFGHEDAKGKQNSYTTNSSGSGVRESTLLHMYCSLEYHLRNR